MNTVNPFDLVIIDYINQFSQLSLIFDYTVRFISKNHLVKGAVLITVLFWGWFRTDKYQKLVQAHLVSTLFGCFIAMVLARVLALSLPFRLRPLHEQGVDFTMPFGMRPTALEGWSAFPSDHAVLFYALSTGMFYISKKVGIFAIVYTTLFISLPRVYLGLHYPTDIIGGAVIGIIVTLLCNSNLFVRSISQSVVNLSTRKPGVFYPIFFIITYQIADMFNNSRAFFSFFDWILRFVSP